MARRTKRDARGLCALHGRDGLDSLDATPDRPLFGRPSKQMRGNPHGESRRDSEPDPERRIIQYDTDRDAQRDACDNAGDDALVAAHPAI